MDKKGIVYSGGERFKVMSGNDQMYFMLVDPYPHGTEADDEYANDYISNLNNLDAELFASKNANTNRYTGRIDITFDPCNDEELLRRVRKGKTKVRLQLLAHATSGNRSGENYGHEFLAWTDDGRQDTRYSKAQFIKLCSAGDKENGPRYYEGTTWIDLTASQLQSGSATLNLDKVLISGLGFAKYFCFSARNSHGDAEFEVEYGQSKKVLRLCVEMYCPAVYRHHKNVNYYDYNEGLYQLSPLMYWFFN